MSGPQTNASSVRRALSPFAAEALGTFVLTTSACSVEIVAATHPELSHAERVVVSALAVLAVIYSVSDVSGAHINPAVTLAFALRGAFRWHRVPMYWLAQLVGAIAGATAARALAGTAADVGATLPKVAPLQAVAIEALLTMLLVTTIVGAAAAVLLAFVIRGPPSEDEEETAEGEAQETSRK